MIGELAQNLINSISTVTALGGRVGAVVGGTATDPTMSEAPVPFAWVIFGGDEPMNDAEGGQKYQRVRYNFSVVVAIEYGLSEADFMNEQLAVLEEIQMAVRGTQGHNYSDLWQYEGQELQTVFPNRLVYNMHFSIIGHHKV